MTEKLKPALSWKRFWANDNDFKSRPCPDTPLLLKKRKIICLWNGGHKIIFKRRFLLHVYMSRSDWKPNETPFTCAPRQRRGGFFNQQENVVFTNRAHFDFCTEFHIPQRLLVLGAEAGASFSRALGRVQDWLRVGSLCWLSVTMTSFSGIICETGSWLGP